jgi:hypothetical protein
MAIVTKLLRIIGLLALGGGCAGALTACSALKLGYGAAPELVFWRLDAYLDLDDAQSARVRDDLSQLHQWHRGNELPRYAALLEQAERLAPSDITPAQACALATQARERIAAVATQVSPALAVTAQTLAPAQLQHLQKHYERKDAEWRKEWMEPPPAEVLERRVKQMTERAEMIYGSLDDAQRAVVQRVVEQTPFDARAVFAERLRRQRDALQTLREVSSQPGMPAAQAREALRGYLQRTQDSPDPVWRQKRDAWLQDSCRGFATLHASTTAAQREVAVRRLRAYQRDLRELAAQR